MGVICTNLAIPNWGTTICWSNPVRRVAIGVARQEDLPNRVERLQQTTSEDAFVDITCRKKLNSYEWDYNIMIHIIIYIYNLSYEYIGTIIPLIDKKHNEFKPILKPIVNLAAENIYQSHLPNLDTLLTKPEPLAKLRLKCVTPQRKKV